MNDEHLHQRIAVFSLNLRFGLANDGPDAWDHRKGMYLPLLGKYPSDFYAFQEANDFQIRYLADLLPGYEYIGEREHAPRYWQSNVIFYKKIWKCRMEKLFYLSPTPDIPSRSRKSRWPRQCTIGVFEKGNIALAVLNTHFDFDAGVQKESARIILNVLAKNAGELPAVLIGDFNAEPGSPCHETLMSGVDHYERHDPGFLNVFEAPFPGTYHKFSGDLNGPHIDWILYRKLISHNATVIRDDFGGRYPADHFPIRAQLFFF